MSGISDGNVSGFPINNMPFFFLYFLKNDGPKYVGMEEKIPAFQSTQFDCTMNQIGSFC